VRLQRIHRRSGQLVAVLAAGAFALTACGSDGPDESADAPSSTTTTGSADIPKASGQISGVGSSAQQAALQAWSAGFQAANSGATINYDPAGSGGGRTQFLAGGNVSFAGSDAALKDDEVAKATTRCGGPVVEVPLYISPIAVVYNLDGVDDLQLSPTTIAKIFNQTIKTWDDPAIKADNPDADLPKTKITPVNRQESSGTTQNFTDYLAKTAAADWAFPVSGDFPVKGGENAQGTSGMVAAVGEADGGIGYVDESQAKDLQIAKIKVGSSYVAPSPEGAAKTVAESPQVTGRTATDLALSLKRDGTDGYPIVLVTYTITCSSYSDAAIGNLVKAFFTYAASDAGQQAAAKAAGSAPLSKDLQTKVQTVLSGIKAGA
jgi:phosphate transport system substrate-binding protein